jgi:fucose 4-O-acetylase-like acetyltransferase
MTRAHTSERTARDPYLDSAKLVLVVLVVLGHNWYFALGSSHVVKAAYMLVYTFHMPAFALVCGYFSRRFEGRPDQLRKLATSLLVPYLVFETLYTYVTAVMSHKPFVLHMSSPVYVCWFLLALFVWRITSPLWRAVPHPVLIALAVSLVAGLTVTSTAFALSRSLQLLPWFVLGLQLRPEHFERLRTRGARAVAAATMALGAVAAYLLAPGFDVRWFDRQWSAHTLGAGPLRFLATAGLLDVATLLLVAAALALVPALPSRLGMLGAFTMYPFLLHGLIVRVLQRSGVHDQLIGEGPLGLILITVGGVALALLLSTWPVRRATVWVVEPPLGLRAAAA